MRASLTAEFNNPASPVRRFLDERFALGLHAVQRRSRGAVPLLALPTARRGAFPGTLGSAAHGLLRFLLDSQPDLTRAVRGAELCASADLDITPALPATDPAGRLPIPVHKPHDPSHAISGPAHAAPVKPDVLATACWALAVLTEASRSASFVPAHRPRTALGPSAPTGNDDLLAAAPPAALHQLSALREAFEQTLLPRLAQHAGPWALGATFTGSPPRAAGADVTAVGLLLDLTTSAPARTRGNVDAFQLIGCALLDFDDASRPDGISHSGARYRHLVTWELDVLLADVAGTPVHLPTLRAQFRTLLLHPPTPQAVARGASS
jgi:hypothetical protein